MAARKKAKEKTNSRLRFAVVGTGAIIRHYHLPAIRNHPRAEVVAIANQHTGSLKALSDETGIQKTFSQFDELAQDPDIDAVVIGAPNYLNCPLSVKFLRNGKHVLCEKPMALSTEEARQMVEAADQSGKQLTIAHVWRSDPEVRWLREVVRSGELGNIYKVKLHAVSAGWGPPKGSWRTQKKLSGGGAMTDVGIHSLDTLAFLFGDELKPKRVYAKTSNRFIEASVEDTASVWIECEDGLVVTMDAGWYEPNVQSLHGAVEIFGDKGYARTLPTEARVEAHGHRGRFEPIPPRSEHVSFSMYQDQMNYFVSSVLDGTESVCSGRDALEGIRLLEAAYLSAATGEFVDLGSKKEGGK